MKIHMPPMTQNTSPGNAFVYMWDKAIEAGDNFNTWSRGRIYYKGV